MFHNVIDELLRAIAINRINRIQSTFPLNSIHYLNDTLLQSIILHHIHYIQHQPAWLFYQLLTETTQFFNDFLSRFGRIAFIER